MGTPLFNYMICGRTIRNTTRVYDLLRLAPTRSTPSHPFAAVLRSRPQATTLSLLRTPAPYSPAVKMGSDEDYEAFLNKANEDVSGASTQTTKKASSRSVNTASVPAGLKKVDAFYTTDSDEPFEPVALEYNGEKVPSAQELGDLIGKDVESISKKEFEAGGSYGDVVEAVEKASKGKVAYFRVDLGGTRSEVWVVGIDGKGTLMGLKAVAILS